MAGSLKRTFFICGFPNGHKRIRDTGDTEAAKRRNMGETDSVSFSDNDNDNDN